MEIKRVKKDSGRYPENLRNIFDAPEELFVNGDILPSDSDAVAIVGTRTPTFYGLENAERISYDLALRGITVVSGMARGIDSAAHRGALKAGGRTIAILGSGHDNIYPPENKKLYEEISRNGAVVSEYPGYMPPLSINFPRRNRIISGLSKGVIVVEAARRSGALITAYIALEQGREVFAMPGSINSAKSNGTNRLIKEGAKLVQNFEDILEELKFVMRIRKPGNGGFPSSVSPEEEAILNALNERPKSIEDISRTAGLSLSRLSEGLLKLELKRLVKALPGQSYVRKR